MESEVLRDDLDRTVYDAVASLGDGAYGVPILRYVNDHLGSRIGRRISIGSMYATLDYLEAQGVLTSWEGGATAERGWRPKRYFKIVGPTNER
jgi:DNA-binding PadR family transcriptional regulator